MKVLTKKDKKALKRIMKKTYGIGVRIPEDKNILIRRIDGDIDYGIENITLLVKAKDVDEVREICKYYPLDGVEAIPTYYDCSGQYHCEPATIKRVAPERFLIKIEGRYDV